ncbi:uncharacterized protein LOC126768020 [Bactrocera neohumeralis]|uniref:uncharacterized protein LOC126768020 n=1 Tax=Bactrocera neohumeralis TaxID=98809 RepID=UPI0021658064|nr:uncharacterized protein LOC126768020 [Bactrocera neohumeralis]
MIQFSTSYATTKYAVEQNINFTLQQTTPASAVTTTTTINNITDATPTDTDIEQDDSEHFILIPFAVLLFIVALSALVFLIGRNRRRLAQTYFRRRSEYRYKFEDDSDSQLERGDTYDFDDPSECLLKGKLQIDNSYDSTLRKGICT